MQAKHISGYYTPYHTIILFELHITIIRDTLAEWYIIECVAVVILTTFRSECRSNNAFSLIFIVIACSCNRAIRTYDISKDMPIFNHG